jgi:hypothetical protein
VRVTLPWFPYRYACYRGLSKCAVMALLEDCLCAFEEIFDCYLQNFRVGPHMIAFSQDQRVFVWINSNFALD